MHREPMKKSSATLGRRLCGVYVLGVGGIDPARAGFASCLVERGVLTYVQMYKPVTGLVTESLGKGT
jgi:hypothetical protein